VILIQRPQRCGFCITKQLRTKKEEEMNRLIYIPLGAIMSRQNPKLKSNYDRTVLQKESNFIFSGDFYNAEEN